MPVLREGASIWWRRDEAVSLDSMNILPETVRKDKCLFCHERFFSSVKSVALLFLGTLAEDPVFGS